MPSDAERIAKKVENHRAQIGKLGQELLAIRKAATGDGPVTPGVQDESPPESENPKPKEADVDDHAQPDAEEDIDDPDAPEVLTGSKELTPAQKSAQDLAFALGVHPDLHAGEKRKLPVKATSDRVKTALQLLAAGAGTVGGIATVRDAAERERLRNVPARGKLAEIRKVIEGAKALEGGEKYEGGRPQSYYFPHTRRKKRDNDVAAGATLGGGLGAALSGRDIDTATTGSTNKPKKRIALPSETGKTFPSIEKTGQSKPVVPRKASAVSALKRTARGRIAGRVGGLAAIGGAIAALADEKSRANVLAELYYAEKNMLEDPDMNGQPGVQDPGEAERIKSELDLSPQEAALFDEIIAEGSGVEQVNAGEGPSPAPGPFDPSARCEGECGGECATCVNKPSNGMEMYRDAPTQGPTDTNPSEDLSADAVEHPEGAGSFQGTPEGEPTSQAMSAGLTSGATANAVPGARKHVVAAPPMGRSEAMQTGQTEEEAFESLVEKLERYEESMQGVGSKSMEYDEKLVRGLLKGISKIGGRIAKQGRQMGTLSRSAYHGPAMRVPGTHAVQPVGPGLARRARRYDARGAAGQMVESAGRAIARNPGAVAGTAAAGTGAAALYGAGRSDRRAY